jgi:hypothetical protein
MWKKVDIEENLTGYDVETIGQVVYDCLIDAGYSPSDIDDIHWDLTVEFYDDPDTD